MPPFWNVFRRMDVVSATIFYSAFRQTVFSKGISSIRNIIWFYFLLRSSWFYLLDTHFSVHFHFREALWQTIVMFTRFYNPEYQPIPITSFGQYFISSLYIIGAVTFFYAIFSFSDPFFQSKPPFLIRKKFLTLFLNMEKQDLPPWHY